MVIALLALAVAMIAGGGVAVVQGYDIVLLERGWTLVISGSVCATGGAILLGLAMVLTRLGRIQAELVRSHDRMSQAEPAFPPRAALDPLAAVSSGLLAGGTGVQSPSPGQSDAQQPTLPLFMRRDYEEANEADAASGRDEGPGHQGPAVAATRSEANLPEANLPEANLPEAPARNDNRGPRLNLPQYLFGGRKAGREKSETEKSEPGKSETTRFEAPVDPGELDFDLGRTGSDGDRGSQPERTSGLVFPAVGAENRGDERRDERSGLNRAPGDEPLEDERDDAAASEAGDTGSTPESGRSVVGTYNSGDNRYVMFSDGSIEAETPEGLFQFGSLDELKDFIASGGERRSGSTPSA